MSHHKDRHYWIQLRSALTAGHWSVQYPAKAYNGAPLSWSELFRKFNKHCRGFNDVSEVASRTYRLASLLATNSKDEDQDDSSDTSHYPLDLGNECLLPKERLEEASAGYEVLKGLESSNFDTINFALAYYAYALGSPSKCLAHLEKIPDILDIQNHMPTQGSIRSNAATLRVPESITAPSLSSTGGSFASLADSSISEIRDGRGWAMTETFRSLCLQGMSHEQLSPSEPHKALKFYGAAMPLLTLAVSEIAPNSASASSGRMDMASFTHFRELWRWVERLIWRAVVLSARTSNIHEDKNDADSIWTWLRHYNACSTYWPASFRTVHRSTISMLYLRAFNLRHSHEPSSPSLINVPRKSPPWLSSARSVVNDYRAILGVSTSFPGAGERNTKVEDFVDLCVALWEASGGIGDHAGWVIDVLWWATRLTFNSYRILRHMTRLLYASGDIALAKRTLRLYIQVVEKAWQANNESLGDDTDDNQHWVETLVSGARMLCKCAAVAPGLEGIKDAREAGECIRKARIRLDKNNPQLVASVDLADGVWNSIMALTEQDPHTRPKRFADAHTLLLRSIETHPTASGHFHLSLSFARPGPSQDLSQAIENAGVAVEGDPTEVRYWHLLGLLLAATERWKDAEEVLEKGAELGENEISDTALMTDPGTLEMDSQTLRVPAPVPVNDRNVQVKEFGGVPTNGTSDPPPASAAPNGTPSTPTPTPESRPPPVYLLEKGVTRIPDVSQLLNPAADHPLPSKQDIFEYSLQLRMSQLALTETVEGAEGAELKGIDIFSWVAEMKGTVNELTPRPSTDDGRLSEKFPSSVLVPAEKPIHDIPAPSSSVLNEGGLRELQPIPITISPAMPADEPSLQRISSEKSERKEQGLRIKRSLSIDRDTSKSKKVQRMLKNRVHKEQARITTISRKIGNGVVRNGSLKRSNSTPDFYSVLRQTSYQASSIHSRRRSSIINTDHDRTPNESPPPPPMPPPQESKRNSRIAQSNSLLADLWLMSAATFRRLGKIEQAKGAIQEAEVRDESNPSVWVQLGLYYVALGQQPHAIDAFQKALFISPDDISASIHLARLYLSMEGLGKPPTAAEHCSNNTDLAAGILSHLTRGNGWDVPEAWYFLAKAYGMQGRKEKERECLSFALTLSESRGIREISNAIGWCI